MTTTQAAPAQNSWTRFLGWVGLAGRLYLGYIFITAGLDKLPHYDATKNAVTAYQLMPWRWISTYALILPVADIRTPDIQVAAKDLSNIYASQKLVVTVDDKRILVQRADAEPKSTQGS